MRSSAFKLFGSLAIAAVGASMAQAYSWASSYGYASATYSESAPGLYATSVGGEYYSFENSSIGFNWTGGDYLEYGPTWNSVNGYSTATEGPAPGSEYFGWIWATNSVTFTNESSNYDSLYVYASTGGFASSSASSWNDASAGGGTGSFYDSNGLILQYSVALAATDGLGTGGVLAQTWNYDIYNGEVDSTWSGGNVFPGYAEAYVSDYQVYELSFAPGASDTFYTFVQDPHRAYSVTPGPAAIAPFVVGLIGALRRLKKA
jgi:hypothetical protein